MTKEEKKSIINEAFGDAQYPGDENLAGNDTGYEDEYAYVRKYFKGKRWQDVDLKWFEEEYPGPHNACLSFMSPQAFRYYLPAYMMIAIDNYETSDADNVVVSALEPEISETLREWHRERISGFTLKQKEAIVTFFHYLKEEHGNDFYPPERLDDVIKYWQQKSND